MPPLSRRRNRPHLTDTSDRPAEAAADTQHDATENPVPMPVVEAVPEAAPAAEPSGEALLEPVAVAAEPPALRLARAH